MDTLKYYTDTIRILVNSPKTPLVNPCKKELNALLRMLEQEVCFLRWRSQDYLFDIREYGVERKRIIQKLIHRIITYLNIFKFFGFLLLGTKQLIGLSLDFILKTILVHYE